VKADVICGKAAASQFERRQTEQLVTPLGEKLPAPFSLVNWVKDLLQIPHFTEGDIYNYVVLKMGIKSRWGLKCTQTDMFMIFSTAQSVMCVITVLWNVKWFQLQMRRKTPPNRWPGCINDLPLYDTLYIINLQCTFSVGVLVSSLIQISTRSATINQPKGADKRVTAGRETGLFTATLRLQISR